MRSFLRGKTITHEKMEDDLGHFHKHLAKIVTGPHPQDCTLLFTGDKGTGKSYASLSLAYAVAKEIAKIRDRDESKWTKYFDLKTCMAIIAKEGIVDLMSKAKPYQVLIFDDAAAGWDARDFAKEGNKFLNHILEVSRTRRNIIIISTPQAFLLDKVPRQLTIYRAHMEGQYFNYDPPFSTMKVYKQKVAKDGHVRNYFPFAGRLKFVLYVVHKPPTDLAIEYNHLRDLAAQREYQRMQEIQSDEDEKRQYVHDKKLKRENLIKQIREDLAAGFTRKEVMRKYNVNRNFMSCYVA